MTMWKEICLRRVLHLYFPSWTSHFLTVSLICSIAKLTLCSLDQNLRFSFLNYSMLKNMARLLCSGGHSFKKKRDTDSVYGWHRLFPGSCSFLPPPSFCFFSVAVMHHLTVPSGVLHVQDSFSNPKISEAFSKFLSHLLCVFSPGNGYIPTEIRFKIWFSWQKIGKELNKREIGKVVSSAVI